MQQVLNLSAECGSGAARNPMRVWARNPMTVRAATTRATGFRGLQTRALLGGGKNPMPECEAGQQ
jgi:hypothetical protein